MKLKPISILPLLLFLFLLFPLMVDAQEYAKPKSGDGINSFLLRHGRRGRAAYNEFIELNKRKLGKKNSLLLGVSYQLPAKTKTAKPAPSLGTTINEPLFGSKYSKVVVKNNRLRGACFYIVSGHGGPDPGAIGKIGKRELHEDEYAYDIAARLARNLMEEGAKVYLIIQDAKDGIRDVQYLGNSKRETCMGAAIPLNQVERLKQRTNKINSLYANDKKIYSYCRAIFLHLDSRSHKKQIDVFFYHNKNNPKSLALANTLRRTFEKKYQRHQPNRGFTGTVSARNLFVLSKTQPTSVFVELGNIQNSFDQRRFLVYSNRQALANWMREGFIQDYQNNSK